MQENPGMFFTMVQIGLNAVAILGGIVGDAAFSPFHSLFSKYIRPKTPANELFSRFSLVTNCLFFTEFNSSTSVWWRLKL